MKTNAIVAENLTYSYGQLTAVDHIAFSVAEGEILGFLGPNGAGKSTTVKMLTGQLRPKEGKATLLGLVDLGASALTAMAQERGALEVKLYPSAEALRHATADGMVDLGLVLPAGFDESVRASESVTVTAYLWGESSMRDRAVSGAALADLIRDLAGQEAPVEIVTVSLGEGAGLSWEERLLPLLILMGIVLGGSMVPAALLVDEKQKRTLRALTTSGTSLGEVFAAKGALGVLISVVMAVVTLWLNRAWGGEPLLLLLSLVLGAIMAAAIGLLLGAFVRDVTTLFSVVKAGGIVLYAPALIYMFPEVPAWIGRLFPTYYLLQPVVEIVQQGASWAQVGPQLAILALLNVVLLAIIAVVVTRAPQSEGALNPA